MSALRAGARGLGEVLITLGVVVLLFVVYELYGTNLYTERQQSQLLEQIERNWRRPSAVAGEVPGVGILYIPRLGDGFKKVIVEGVGTDDLKKGPGHIPETADPGQVGNFVVSGHRTTYGAPFSRLDELRPDDAIVVETRDQWLVYRMTEQQIVAPNAIEVTYPVPGRPGAVPSERLLTLTTCNPKYSAKTRLIVHARLESAQPRSAGPPPGLQVT